MTRSARPAWRRRLATIGLFLVVGLSGLADSVPSVFSTGVDAAGEGLPAGAVDPHWKLVQSPDGSAPGPNTYVVQEGFPIPPWLANDGDSKWIAPKADQGGGNSPGDYHYRLEFDLSGFDPATARVTGVWSSDNSGIEVRLNGVATGLSFNGDFAGWSPTFTLSTGFVEGLNALEFVVNNAGDGINPTGFRARLTGTAERVAVNSPPRIVQDPRALTVAFKESATWVVSATGSRPLEYQWRRNGQPVSEGTTATWVIPFVGAADAGVYDVIVRNAFGSVTSAPATLTVTFPGTASEQSEPPGPSSRRTGLAITEIMYQPAARADGANLEFIELYNSNPFGEELGGWRLAGEVEFTFPVGTVIGGKQYLVVAADPTRFQQHSGLTGVLGGWSGRLANEGGRLQLRKASGAVVLELEYRPEPPWPLAAAGAGHSLVLRRPSLGEAAPGAWSASSRVNGSPGREDAVSVDPLASVRIQEVLANPSPGESAWVEVFNPTPQTLDLSGCHLSPGLGLPGVTLPAGTLLVPGASVHWDQTLLNWPGEPAGGVWYLWNPDQTAVLDAVRFGASLPGVSQGATASSRGSLRALLRPTPGVSNTGVRLGDVQFSEILFHPLTDDDGDEFVELVNRGEEAADLSGWRISGDVEFEFPDGAVLAPGGYAVVVRDRAHFGERHPQLSVGSIWGNYRGVLSNREGELTLERRVRDPQGTRLFWVPESGARFRDGNRVNRWADGGGSSLERVDFRSDPLLPDSWADSEESDRADWTLVETTGLVNQVHPGVPNADQLQIILLGAGEALVDAVEVRVGTGANRVANGTFEANTTGWTFQGTHRPSRRETGVGFESSGALRVVATDRGDHVANRVRGTLTQAIPAGSTVTLRARVRWLTGHPEILLRLRGGGIEAVGRLSTPLVSGTPAAANRRTLTNAGPILTEVQPSPVLPAGGEPVRIRARVEDPDGLSRVFLRYRRDPSSTFFEAPMTDNGTGPDERAGDGVYSGLIPGQPAGTLVAFTVQAEDAAPVPVRQSFPPGPLAREALVRFGETPVASGFGAYRIWLTSAARSTWAAREKMSNEDVDATFVYGDHRVIYAAGAHYSGSSYTSPGYDSPTGNLCGYNVNFPPDDRLLGDNRLTLDWPIRDNTNQREQLMYWFLDQFALPNMYRRYVHLYVNGLRRGVIYDDIQQPDGDTVNEWFADDDEGSLWKTDCWNEFDNGGNRIDPCVLNTLERFPASGPLKVSRYRWNWRPRAVRGSANDFTDLFQLVETMNRTSDYVNQVESLVDVDHWMRTFAMNDLASFWDAFGNSNGKNTFLYKPERSGWKLMSWDFDVGLGVFNDPPNLPLFEVNDPVVARMYQTPAFVRRYWAALEEALTGFFRTGAGTAVDRRLDARYAAFQAEGLGLEGPAGIKSWINQRRSFLAGQLNSVRSSFAVSTQGGADFATNANPVILRGTAPVAVATVRVNGVEYPLRWTSVTAWELTLPLAAGTNVLAITGVDRGGRVVAGAEKSLSVTFTGEPPPLADVRINEWMAANTSAVMDPVDGEFADWLELYNPGAAPVSLTGWSLTDDLEDPRRSIVPAGFAVPPGGHLVVWADRQPEQTQAGVSLHVNFRLGQAGEEVGLFDSFGRLVDRVEFGPQVDDVSEGRWPDGLPEPFFPLVRPSPGTANAVASDVGVVRVLALEVRSTGTVDLTWASLPGRSYRVRVWTGLNGPELTGGEVVVAEGLTTTVIDTAPGSGERFYQVMLVE